MTTLKSSSSKVMGWIIILIGIALRLVQYGKNYSFWADEAVVALKLNSVALSKFFFAAAPDLDNILSYPIGFIFLEKIILNILGDGELALRIFPLLAGIGSLFLFKKLSEKLLSKGWALFGLSVFVLSTNLIHYAAEAKPYSSDVFFFLILALALYRFSSNKITVKQSIFCGCLGILSIFFSFPSMIVLAGVGAYTLIHLIVGKEWGDLKTKIFAMLLWGVGAFLYYSLSLKNLMYDQGVATYFTVNFMPFFDGPLSLFQWFIVSFKRIFLNDLNLLPGLAGALSLIAIVSFYRQKKEGFILCVMPIAMTLILSTFKIYPFGERVITFLIPAFILLVVEGAKIVSEYKDKTLGKIIAGVLITLLLIYPASFAYKQFNEKVGQEDIKPVLKYLADHKGPNDLIANYHGAIYAYRYYAPKFGINSDLVVLNRPYSNKGVKKEVIDPLKGHKRVWIVFTHVRFYKDRNERKAILQMLDQVGHRVDEFVLKHTFPFRHEEKNISASVYLYDMT